MKSGSSGLKLKSSQQLVPSVSERVTTIYQEYNGFMEGQESKQSQSQKIEMSKARSTTAKHKLKPWQKVTKPWQKVTKKGGKPGQPRELKHKKRRKGTTWMQAEAQDLKQRSRQKKAGSATISNQNYAISIFRIGRSVMQALSSRRCFNMPTHCNSDMSTTCDQDSRIRRCSRIPSNEFIHL